MLMIQCLLAFPGKNHFPGKTQLTYLLSRCTVLFMSTDFVNAPPVILMFCDMVEMSNGDYLLEIIPQLL